MLEAYGAILPHNGEKFLTADLQVDLSRKERTAQPSGLLTEDKLQKMMKKSSHYALDRFFLFVVSFIDRSLRFVEKCDLTRTSVLYTKIFSKCCSITTQCCGR